MSGQNVNIIASVSQSDPNKPVQVNQANQNIEEDDQEQEEKFSLINYFCKCLIFQNKDKKQKYLKQQEKNQQNQQQQVAQVAQKYMNQNIVADQPEEFKGKKTLVLDLDETLVHSSFQPMQNSDYVLQITVQGTKFTVYVKKRTGCEDFLNYLAQFYEIFVYTASLAEYADPVIDLIDPQRVVTTRLYREHCTLYNNVFVKDMTQLNRNIHDIIIVDNSEASFLFQPENAIHIKAFFEDRTDLELYRYMPFLEFLAQTYDVRYVMRWIEIFEQAENEVLYIDRQAKNQAYKKTKALENFEEEFPGKYIQEDPQDMESCEEPFTARRGEADEKVEEGIPDEEDFAEQNLDSHKGMLNKNVQKSSSSQHSLEKKNKNNKFVNQPSINTNNEVDDDIDSDEINTQDQQVEEDDDEEQEEIEESQNQFTSKQNQKKNSQSNKENIEMAQTSSRKERRNQQMKSRYSSQDVVGTYLNNSNNNAGKKGKKMFSKPNLQIDVDDDVQQQQQQQQQQQINNNNKESTKHLISGSGYSFKSKKAKEFEDHAMFNSPKATEGLQYNMMTQPREIMNTEEDVEEAKKKFFNNIRFDAQSKMNFNSPVARQNYIQFLSKNNKKKQQEMDQQQEDEEIQEIQ